MKSTILNFKRFSLLNFLLLSLSINSQSLDMPPITDIDGQDFDYSYNTLNYNSKSNLSVNYNKEYEEGIYVDTSGKKIKGFIKLDENDILFKQDLNGPLMVIKSKNIKFVKIGIDSFFTASNFYYKKLLKKTPEFLQFIGETNDFYFAKYYKISKRSVVEHILAKKKNDSLNTIWFNFHDYKAFKKLALKCFGHINYLKLKIESREYGKKELMSMIKISEYHEKFKNNTPVYFDKYWQETFNISNHEFKANITQIKDSIITFQYYHKDKKTFEFSYSSFYPTIKNGEFLSFFENGELQKKIVYKDNKPQDVKIFNKKNILNKHYIYVDKKKDSKENNKQRKRKKHRNIDTSPKTKMIRLLDFRNDNVVNDSGNFTHQIKDSITGFLYSNIYKNGLLKKSYRIANKDTIFQLLGAKNFELFKLKSKLSGFINSIDFSNALLKNAQGTVFISIVMNKKGQVESFKILNKIHMQIDVYVYKFAKKHFDKTSRSRYRFKRENKTPKQFYETILPIHFSNNRFYRKPASYNYYPNFMFDLMIQQQMMQQQMMNSNMRSF